MECPRCHEPASAASLACGTCRAPLRLGDEPQPARLDRLLDLDRRARLDLAHPGPLHETRGEAEGGAAAQRDLEPTAPAAAPSGPAPLLARMGAGVVDLAIVVAGTAPFVVAAAAALPAGADAPRALLPAAGALVALVTFAYATLSSAVMGTTPGGRLLGVAVVDGEGAAPGLGRSALRSAVAIAGTLALGLGLLPAVFTASRRAAHDRVSGTSAVRVP